MPCIVPDLLLAVRGAHLKDTGLGLEQSHKSMGALYTFEFKVGPKCSLAAGTVNGIGTKSLLSAVVRIHDPG